MLAGSGKQLMVSDCSGTSGSLYFGVCVVPADDAGGRVQVQANQRLVPVGLDFIVTIQKTRRIK